MAARKRAKAARSGARAKRAARATGKKSATRARAAARKPARRPSAPRPATPATPPNAIGCVHAHVDYTTHAGDEMKRFYTEVLGFSDFAEDRRFQYLLVRLTPGSSIGFMPPMPGPPEQWRPPREPAIYLHVKDVDRAYRDLMARGVTFQQEPTDMPWDHRVAMLRDPEGRTICLAQILER